MNIFDTNSTQTQRILLVDSPQEIIAFGLNEGDSVSVEIALVGKLAPNTVVNGCSIIDNTNQAIPVEGSVPYTICENPIEATFTNPRFVIDRPGQYLINFNGSLGEAVVRAQPASQAAIRQFYTCVSMCF